MTSSQVPSGSHAIASLRQLFGRSAEDATNEEKVPLLPKLSVREEPTSRFPTSLKDVWGSSEHSISHNDKIVYYDHRSLLAWQTAFNLGWSVFRTRAVLHMLFSVIGITSVTAVLVAVAIPHARRLDTKVFDMFLTFLKVFISFMLGIYIQQSFLEWWKVVTNWCRYLISIRHLIFFLFAAKVRMQDVNAVQRLALAATYLLNTEALCIQELVTGDSDAVRRTLLWLLNERFLEKDEHDNLVEVSEWASRQGVLRSLALTGTVWAWIGEIVSEAATAEGNKLDPPMFARLLHQCQAPVDHMQDMKIALVAQVPYMYCQLLTCLVYINNSFLGLACGLTIGSAAAEIYDRSHQMQDNVSHDRLLSLYGQLYQAIQQLGTRVLIGILEPLLYVGFLQIGNLLCYPFGEETYHLPTETMIARLHSDLALVAEAREFSNKKRERIAETSRIRRKNKDEEDLEAQSGGDDDMDDDGCD